MAAITTTGTLTAGNSRTFALAPGSALTLTLLPNCRVTVTETPETVSASDAGGNSPRTHNHQLAGVVTYGPYAMGGSVVVDNASNSGSTVSWGRKDTAVTTSSDGLSLVSGDRTFPVLNATAKLGSNYAAVVLPLNQSAGNPTDYSGNSVAVTIGASNTEAEAWANAGFFTSKAIVGSAGAIIPNSSIGVDLAVDSFIRAFTVARPITADTFAGCSDGTIPGVNVIMNASGLIGPRLYVAAGVNFSALYGTAVVGGSALLATTNAAGYAVGATTMTLASAGTGAIIAGDLIQFGTDPNLYTVSTGDADVSGGGTVVIPSPGLLKAIPASATPINVVAGTRVRRVMLAWDAPTKTMYQYVDGVLDFAYVATQSFAASEIETGAFNLGRSATGSTFGAKFAGFAQLTFPDAGLPKNTSEIAVQDNLLRRTGPANIAVFI